MTPERRQVAHPADDHKGLAEGIGLIATEELRGRAIGLVDVPPRIERHQTDGSRLIKAL